MKKGRGRYEELILGLELKLTGLYSRQGAWNGLIESLSFFAISVGMFFFKPKYIFGKGCGRRGAEGGV